MSVMSDEEIQAMIEDYEASDAHDDGVALCEQEMSDVEDDERAERLAAWQRERANITADELPAYLLRQQAAVALTGLACQVMTRGSIPARRLTPYALVWMERVGAIAHNGGVEDGGTLWWRVESERLRRQAGQRGLVWLCLSDRGLALKIPPGEVIAIAAARAIPELTDDERRREHDELVSRMERVRKQRHARERVDEVTEEQEARRYAW